MSREIISPLEPQVQLTMLLTFGCMVQFLMEHKDGNSVALLGSCPGVPTLEVVRIFIEWFLPIENKDK